MQVPLLDLKAQYAAIRQEVEPVIKDICENQSFILGPTVAAFEEAVAAYCGSKFAVGVSSGSDALLMSLMAIGIKPGDEVITTRLYIFRHRRRNRPRRRKTRLCRYRSRYLQHRSCPRQKSHNQKHKSDYACPSLRPGRSDEKHCRYCKRNIISSLSKMPARVSAHDRMEFAAAISAISAVFHFSQAKISAASAMAAL